MLLARLVRERLKSIGLNAAPITSSSNVMHLYAALPGVPNSTVFRNIARALTRAQPELVVWKMTKSLRSRGPDIDVVVKSPTTG